MFVLLNEFDYFIDTFVDIIDSDVESVGSKVLALQFPLRDGVGGLSPFLD